MEHLPGKDCDRERPYRQRSGTTRWFREKAPISGKIAAIANGNGLYRRFLAPPAKSSPRKAILSQYLPYWARCRPSNCNVDIHRHHCKKQFSLLRPVLPHIVRQFFLILGRQMRRLDLRNEKPLKYHIKMYGCRQQQAGAVAWQCLR
jgi:hypothetical protein